MNRFKVCRRSWGLLFAGLGICLCTASLSAAQEPSQHRLVTLDGQVLSVTVTAIDQKGILTGPGVPPDTSLESLRRLETVSPGGGDTSGITSIVDLAGGGRVLATSFTMNEEQVGLVKNPLIGELKLPIDGLRAVRFDNKKETLPTFAEAAKEKSDDDRVFVRVGETVQAVRGLIESVDDASVAFDISGDIQKLARAKVYGIAFAFIGRQADHEGECLVRLNDGSTLWGKIHSLADGKLQMRLSEGVDVSLPMSAVAEFSVRSSRLVFLSDLEPVDARHHPLITLQRPYQRNLSVGGRPLTLGQRTFDQGLGVASRSVLTYSAGGKFDLLAAVIGIDAETEGRGDCVFVVEGDGRELYRQRVTGKDAARPIQVDISGVDTVTLLVEPGEDLDLADHADWCDVRFVKNPK